LRSVVLATALPIWLASAFLLYQVQTEGRSLMERDAGAAARALIVAVDHDLAGARGAAQVLAASPYLASGDLGAFRAQAIALLPSIAGNNVVLTDASGQQLLNTLRPSGEPLPRHGDPDLLRRVFDTGKPAISDLYVGGVRRTPVVSIDVPVMRDGKVTYDLSIGFFLERLSEILRQERLPKNWVVAIFDSKGVIVARTHAADRFVGQKGAPALVEEIARTSEGIVETRTLEGTPVSAAFSRSQISGWAVAIGLPTRDFNSVRWRYFGWSVAITLALIAFSLVAARFTSERLTRAIRILGVHAAAFARGEQVELRSLGLKEVDEVARSLATGAKLLEERTAERDREWGRRHTVQIAKGLADEAARTRSAYFAYLSHELRSPLTAVLGCSDFIATRIHATTHDEKVLDYCARIESGVSHLIGVIDEILDFAKYEASELELHRERLDVKAEIRAAVELLEGRAQQSDITLRYRVATDLPPLCADRARLRQILLNLLSNALKFTPAGGRVTVDAAVADGTQLVIRVEDTGTGIDAEELARVMQPFAQGSNARGGSRLGTGLGLPLTQGLVELHGGSLTLTSTPGVGTIVTVALPLTGVPPAESQASMVSSM
jgi:signal transduction histidine kinase